MVQNTLSGQHFLKILNWSSCTFFKLCSCVFFSIRRTYVAKQLFKCWFFTVVCLRCLVLLSILLIGPRSWYFVSLQLVNSCWAWDLWFICAFLSSYKGSMEYSKWIQNAICVSTTWMDAKCIYAFAVRKSKIVDEEGVNYIATVLKQVHLVFSCFMRTFDLYMVALSKSFFFLIW